jgi:hypothetical protein
MIMVQETVNTAATQQTRAALACRLRHRPGRRGPSPTAGEVEIENISQEEICIEVTMHPLQYLDLAITDAAGAPLPTRPYGNIFSPRETPYLLRLAPGEKYTHNVSLLGNVAAEKQLPGAYTVQAVYEHNGLRAVSEPVSVCLPPAVGSE